MFAQRVTTLCGGSTCSKGSHILRVRFASLSRACRVRLDGAKDRMFASKHLSPAAHVSAPFAM